MADLCKIAIYADRSRNACYLTEDPTSWDHLCRMAGKWYAFAILHEEGRRLLGLAPGVPSEQRWYGRSRPYAAVIAELDRWIRAGMPTDGLNVALDPGAAAVICAERFEGSGAEIRRARLEFWAGAVRV
jgi:hypothetical protein